MWHPDPQINRQRQENLNSWRSESRDYSGSGCGWIMIGVVVAAVFGIGALLRMAGDLFGGSSAPVAARVSPEQVVQRYVNAMLNDRDDAAAAALTCKTPQLEQFRSLQQDLITRETDFSIAPIRATVIAYSESRTGGGVDAAAEIMLSTPQSRVTQNYNFSLVSEGSWKICGAASVR